MAPFFRFFLVLFVAVVSSLIPPVVPAEEFYNALDLEGTTGLLNTPNAEVTDDGSGSMLYSNQKEPTLRHLTREDNYFFSVGLLPFMEVVGRVTDASGGSPRDLSVNAKLKLLPDVAIGIQDLGGGSQYFRTEYVVATETWRPFRMSLGYGNGPSTLKGVFGGVEFKATDWLTLLGEDDTKERNVGLRLLPPSLFGWPIHLQFTAKTSLDYHPGSMEYGIGFQIPLGSAHVNRQPLPPPAVASRDVPHQADAIEDSPNTAHPQILPDRASTDRVPYRVTQAEHTEPSPLALSRETVNHSEETAPQPEADHNEQRLHQLFGKLVADGFQNVRVGVKGQHVLVVEYENARYRANELDGLGVVIGFIVDTVPKEFETVHIVIKKENIQVLRIAAPVKTFRAFLRDPSTYGTLNRTLSIAEGDSGYDEGVRVIAGPGNPSRFTSSLMVSPGLTTAVATDAGAFDYLLSAQLDYFVNAWSGAVLYAGWLVPLSWSKNFEDGRPFRSERTGGGLDRLMLFQAFPAASDVMVNLGAGLLQPSTYGTLNEAMWTPGDGTYQFSFKQAYALDRSPNALFRKHEMYLGSCRYYFSPLDLSLQVVAGKFIENDTGFTVALQRFFGDTSLTLYYTNSDTISQEPFFPPEHVRVVGLSVALPLTPRKEMKPGLFQVRGTEAWGYSQSTVLASAGGANYTALGYVGNNLTLPNNLDRVFFNRDRLSEPYIRGHLLRLRDAYITYLQHDSAPSATSDSP